VLDQIIQIEFKNKMFQCILTNKKILNIFIFSFSLFTEFEISVESVRNGDHSANPIAILQF